jgi:hypothetical protein
MSRHYNSYGAPLGSQDVAMIRSLVKEHCERRRCDRQGVEAEDAARQLLRWFQGGIIDRKQLRRLLHGGIGIET